MKIKYPNLLFNQENFQNKDNRERMMIIICWIIAFAVFFTIILIKMVNVY